MRALCSGVVENLKPRKWWTDDEQVLWPQAVALDFANHIFPSFVSSKRNIFVVWKKTAWLKGDKSLLTSLQWSGQPRLPQVSMFLQSSFLMRTKISIYHPSKPMFYGLAKSASRIALLSHHNNIDSREVWLGFWFKDPMARPSICNSSLLLLIVWSQAITLDHTMNASRSSHWPAQPSTRMGLNTFL